MASDDKLHVAIIFGGRSGEHEISLRSARSVLDAIDISKYSVTLLGIARDGRWHLIEPDAFRALSERPLAALDGGSTEVLLRSTPGTGELLDLRGNTAPTKRLDVVFPVLHGTYGEDGTIQGFLELADLPYVGAGVLGSAVGMDKDVQKRLLRDAGVPIVNFVTVSRHDWSRDSEAIKEQARRLGLPLFVKPANLGSSVGITKVKHPDALGDAITAAFRYDTKVVVEAGIDAREIECAVLGNDDLRVSVPGEICPTAEFYSYEAKYIDEKGAALLIPAPLTSEQTTAVQELALRTFRLLDCSGMARVDCFLERSSGKFYLNEINTIPGFTSISMYPKLWEASGLSYRELISRLLELAIERHQQRRGLQRIYAPIRSGPNLVS